MFLYIYKNAVGGAIKLAKFHPAADLQASLPPVVSKMSSIQGDGK